MTDAVATEVFPAKLQDISPEDGVDNPRLYEDIMQEMGQVVEAINTVWTSQESINAKVASRSSLQNRISELKQEAVPYVREDLVELIAPLNHSEVLERLRQLTSQGEEPTLVFEYILKYERGRQLASNPQTLFQASYDELTIAYNNIQEAFVRSQEDSENAAPAGEKVVFSAEDARQRIYETQEFFDIYEIKGVIGSRHISYLLNQAQQLLEADTEPAFYPAIGEFCEYAEMSVMLHISDSLYSPATTQEQFLEFFRNLKFDDLFDTITIEGLEAGAGEAYQLTKAEIRDRLKALDLPAACLFGIRTISFIPQSEAPPIEIYKPGEDRPVILDRGGDCGKIYTDEGSNCVTGGKIRLFVREEADFSSNLEGYREGMIDVLSHELGHNLLTLAPVSDVRAWYRQFLAALRSGERPITPYAGEYQQDSVRFVEESFAELLRLARDPWNIYMRDERWADLYVEQIQPLLPEDKQEDFITRWQEGDKEVKEARGFYDGYPFEE